MVKVRDEQPRHYDGTINLELWLKKIQDQSKIDSIDQLRVACDLAWSAEKEPDVRNEAWTKNSYQTALEMVDILAPLGMDEESLCSAVVYRAVREEKTSIAKVRSVLGSQIAALVEGVLRMAVISGIKFVTEEPVLGQTEAQLDQARKMLISLVDDVRVALIKLAERTCAIRSAANREWVKRQALAHEIMDIYAPLAHRLGIGYLKWELEDLAFRYLEPEEYMRIARLLAEKRIVRQTFVEKTIRHICAALESMVIEADVHGRAKHIFSIWRKMQEKNIPFEQVYDVRAVRVLVDTEDECYRVLGAVHKLWHNIPHEFDDYIATPKENGYRSLHTAVYGPEGKVIEIQIRTQEMHHEAELGVCSHWQYKWAGDHVDTDVYDEKLHWLRQLLDWQEDMGDFPGMARDLIAEIGKHRIYVFTPEGHVVDMMPEATPLDFAYRIHTEVGHHCVGARVNGKIVSLRSQLVTGDQIQILTDESARPRREWLYGHFGYLKSSRARLKVQSWFYQRDQVKNIEEGKRILSEKLNRLGVDSRALEALASSADYNAVDDICARLGAGLVPAKQALEQIQDIKDLLQPDQQQALTLPPESKKPKTGNKLVTGAGEAEVVIAACCMPENPDPVAGVLLNDGQIQVHRQDCEVLLTITQPENLLEIGWQEADSFVYSIPIHIRAYDRPGLLFDLTSVLHAVRINMTSMNTRFDDDQNIVNFLMDVDVDCLDTLVQLLEKIEHVHNVIDAKKK